MSDLKCVGRPKKNPIDFLQTKVWYFFLARWVIRTDDYLYNSSARFKDPPAWRARNLGFASAYCISHLVDGPNAEATTWKRYRDGGRAIGRYGGANAVQRAANKWPSTSKIFDSLIWQLLKRAKVDSDDIVAELKTFEDHVGTIIFGGGFTNWGTSDEHRKTVDGVLRQLSEFPTWSTLQAIILMLGWANNLGNIELKNSICDLYRLMIPEFIRADTIPFQDEIFDAVDDVAVITTFPVASVREDKFQSWREQIPKYLEQEQENELLFKSHWEQQIRNGGS